MQYIIKDGKYTQIEKHLARSRNHCFHGEPKITFRLYCLTTRSRKKCKTYGLHVMCPMFLPDYKTIVIPRHIFIKVFNFEFLENSFCLRRADIFGQREREKEGWGEGEGGRQTEGQQSEAKGRFS